MAVRIRMKKTGGKNKPCYRIVVADARSQRDGKIIENLGFYDPRHDNEKINIERADYWISVGAQASETVAGVIKRAKGESNVKKPAEKKAEQEVKSVAKEEVK
ncbi:MAG TPA: 30S ribosomal protein S16 [Victivallales bacterium]|nr:30S ribosomal protein S16 [Victivallales bacterium]